MYWSKTPISFIRDLQAATTMYWNKAAPFLPGSSVSAWIKLIRRNSCVPVTIQLSTFPQRTVRRTNSRWN